MLRVREHVHGLYTCYLVLLTEQGEVAGLCGRITAHIHNALRGNVQQLFHYLLVHAGTWWVSDDNVGCAVLFDEISGEHLSHVTGKETGVGDAVQLRVLLGIHNELIQQAVSPS